nr:hypothetical protein CFP56_03332 [Quercus suber]
MIGPVTTATPQSGIRVLRDGEDMTEDRVQAALGHDMVRRRPVLRQHALAERVTIVTMVYLEYNLLLKSLVENVLRDVKGIYLFWGHCVDHIIKR